MEPTQQPPRKNLPENEVKNLVAESITAELGLRMWSQQDGGEERAGKFRELLDVVVALIVEGGKPYSQPGQERIQELKNKKNTLSKIYKKRT